MAQVKSPTRFKVLNTLISFDYKYVIMLAREYNGKDLPDKYKVPTNKKKGLDLLGFADKFASILWDLNGFHDFGNPMPDDICKGFEIFMLLYGALTAKERKRVNEMMLLVFNINSIYEGTDEEDYWQDDGA